MLDPVDSTRLYQTQDGGVTWQIIEPLGEVSALGEVERVDLPLGWLDGQLLLPAWTSSRAAEAALVFLTSSLDSNTLAANGAWVEAATAVVPQSLWETLNPNLTISQISIFLKYFTTHLNMTQTIERCFVNTIWQHQRKALLCILMLKRC